MQGSKVRVLIRRRSFALQKSWYRRSLCRCTTLFLEVYVGRAHDCERATVQLCYGKIANFNTDRMVYPRLNAQYRRRYAWITGFATRPSAYVLHNITRQALFVLLATRDITSRKTIINRFFLVLPVRWAKRKNIKSCICTSSFVDSKTNFEFAIQLYFVC